MHPRDRGSLPRVTVVTHSPSPYQVELFDAITAHGRVELKVIYLHARDAQRLWQSPPPHHDHVMLTQPELNIGDVLEQTDAADLVVINYYKHPFAEAAMRRRANAGGAVCFWGERPQRLIFPMLGTLLRKWRLRSLMHGRSHIWGIGRMAVDAYRSEFGPGRVCVNLPYFSDLRRFSDATHRPDDGTRVFLFSGSLSHRKGVDVLASVFARIAPDFPRARLRVMGCGDMETLMRQRLQGCMDRVEFTGFRDWKDLHLEYAQADSLCAPSRHDGWGLVVPEGLAAGLPVISTQQTGAAVEFVRPGSNGWLVPEGNEEALHQAMRQAATLSAGQWNEMSEHARDSVAGHSLENGARRFVEAAESALADWDASPEVTGRLAASP